MKNKYDLAIRYYNETGNKEELDLAYSELELFNKTFEIFFYYLKIDNNTLNELLKKDEKNTQKNNENLNKSKNSIKNTPLENIKNEKNSNNNNIANKFPNDKFYKIISLYQMKISEKIFDEANFNNELLNYTINKHKVINNEKNTHNDYSNDKISEQNSLEKNKQLKGDFSTQISCLLLFLLLFFSFLTLFIQNYFYYLNVNEQIRNTNNSIQNYPYNAKIY